MRVCVYTFVSGHPRVCILSAQGPVLLPRFTGDTNKHFSLDDERAHIAEAVNQSHWHGASKDLLGTQGHRDECAAFCPAWFQGLLLSAEPGFLISQGVPLWRLLFFPCTPTLQHQKGHLGFTLRKISGQVPQLSRGPAAGTLEGIWSAPRVEGFVEGGFCGELAFSAPGASSAMKSRHPEQRSMHRHRGPFDTSFCHSHKGVSCAPSVGFPKSRAHLLAW